MASIALPSTASAFSESLPCRAKVSTNARVWTLTGLVLVVAVAAFVRFWEASAILASSDQATIAWTIRHSFGFQWILAHNYGPVLPFVQRSWAELVYRLNLPLAEEAAVRVPIAVASLLQVAATFALVRRLGRTRLEAGLCMMTCALLPTIVSDAHFAWGYNTLWLLNGTVALWATLAWLQDRRPSLLLIAAAALMLHCLSNCFAFALPITLLYVWIQALHTRTSEHCKISWRAFVAGYVVPCLLALVFIVVCYVLTGEGQIGRLVFKRDIGTTGASLSQIFELPGMWAYQFGYLFGAIAAIALIWASFNPKVRLLAVWAWAGLIPILLLVNWEHVGFVGAYLVDCAYAAGLLGTLWVCTMYRRMERRPVARTLFACASAFAMLHMAIATCDASFHNAGLAAWTGVPVSWGSVKPESGIKAAGWYVRKHVPANAIVMSAHTNTGMEVTVAEYYCGRSVVAGYDLKPTIVAPLLREMSGSVDVIIVEPAWAGIADSLPDFQRTATFRHQGQAVRYVYARPALGLARVDSEAEILNARYDRECASRKVPQVLLGPDRIDTVLREYQRKIKTLSSASIPAAH